MNELSPLEGIMSNDGIRESIERVRAAISADPEKARAKNTPATARLTSGLQCVVSGPHGERLVTDMPPAMGGAASGPNPGWLLRGALASCTATVIAMRAAQLGIDLNGVEVTVESASDNRGMLGLDESVPAGLRAIRTTVTIRADGGSADQLRDLVQWADAHSPVGCTLRRSPSYSLEIRVA